ncbi:MAG: hypothetical protein LBS55_07180, partial [Prevotellaceae bacterium]|nr:hypothetical protein [Prevotellaceae bacterium]
SAVPTRPTGPHGRNMLKNTCIPSLTGRGRGRGCEAHIFYQHCVPDGTPENYYSLFISHPLVIFLL